MAKKAAKKPAKSGVSKRPKSLSSLLGKPGATVKVANVRHLECTTGESAGSFVIEGSYTKSKPRSKARPKSK